MHLLYVLTSLTLDGLYVDLIQTLHKKLSVFCVHDGLDGCAKNADIILLKNTVLIELDAAVESCLAAEGQQDAIGVLLLYDTFDEIGLNRKEVDLVGYSFRSLNRGDVGVDEHGLYAFFAQSFQSLRT